MRTARHLALATGLALATPLATPLATAGAQDTPAGVRPYRFTVSGHLANYWMDRGGDASRATVGGFGVRVLFNRSDPAEGLRTLFGRASFGASATFTTDQDDFAASTQNIQAEADIALFPTPIARGVLDPFVSLGAGLFRTSNDSDVADEITTTDFVLTPGAGTRIPFFSGIGFRGDLRAPIIFGEDTRLNWLVEGGIYISF